MKMLLGIGFVAMVLGAGCAVDPSAPTEEPGQAGEEQRGPIGKADLYGSCAANDGGDYCGGQSDGNCWCDEACESYGDCCTDVGDVCGGGNDCHDANDPAVHYVSQDPLQCAAIFFTCEQGQTLFFDDCGCGCVDEPQPQSCGGWAQQQCAAGEYCDYTDAACGFADQTGVCKIKPEACIAIVAPVCGCNGVTYGNFCEANANGVSVKSEGACACGPETCGPGYECQYCWGGLACVPEGALC